MLVGFREESENTTLVWKLKRSLYGLKQSGRNWNVVLSQFFISNGFTQSKVDVCLFTLNNKSGDAFVVVWVDDIILAANSNTLLHKIKNDLKEKFQMKDLGPISYFLGIQFNQTKNTISMSQSHYLTGVLRRFKMEDCKPRSTPCESNLDAYKTKSNDITQQEDNVEGKYREIVGSLVYAMTCSRPDLAWVVTKLSQHLENPSDRDWMTLRHVLRYVKGTVNHRLVYRKSKNGLKLTGHSDSDWASTKDDRRSTTGYAFRLNQDGPIISWKSRKQHTVALSSCEAEYMALTHATQELIFLSNLSKDFNITIPYPITIYGDNQGSLDMVKNPVSNERSKHIDIKHHFIREKYSEGLIDVCYVPTGENLADIFTKPVTKPKLQKYQPILFGQC